MLEWHFERNYFQILQSRTTKKLLRQGKMSSLSNHKYLHPDMMMINQAVGNSKNKKEDRRCDVYSALMARLNFLEQQHSKQKDSIKMLKQENMRLKSDRHRKYVTRQELKHSSYGGQLSDAQLDFILNGSSLSPNTHFRKGGQSLKWTSEDIVQGIILFQRLFRQGMYYCSEGPKSPHIFRKCFTK